jgi:hypothetical protein
LTVTAARAQHPPNIPLPSESPARALRSGTEMRRFFLSLLLLGIFGALLGAVLTWPEGASDVARNSPTLPEFQTGVRVFQPSGPSPVPAAQAEPIATGEMTLAAERLRHVMDEAAYALDPASDTSQRSLAQMPSAGENVPLSGQPRLPGWHPKPFPTGSVARPVTTPVQVATAVAGNAPTTDPPVLPAAVTDAPRQHDPQTEDPVLALGMDRPRTQTQDDHAKEAPHPTLMTGRHTGHISIHYHSDVRSRTDAQRILNQLGSAGLSMVQMHTTARGTTSSLVRYFSQQDAPAAVSLAKMLESKTAPWRAEDCTGYRHKPEPGSLQLWPATAAANSPPMSAKGSMPAKGKSPPRQPKLNAAR